MTFPVWRDHFAEPTLSQLDRLTAETDAAIEHEQLPQPDGQAIMTAASLLRFLIRRGVERGASNESEGLGNASRSATGEARRTPLGSDHATHVLGRREQ